MIFIYSIAIIWIGALASSQDIINKYPQSRDFFQKVGPYQPAIGVGSIFMFLMQIDKLGITIQYMKFGIFPFIISTLFLVSLACFLILGYIFAYPLLSQWFQNAKALQNLDKIFKRISPYRIKTGKVAMLVGVLTLFKNFFFGMRYF